MRLVQGEKELMEKLGRKDLCPCGSGRRFQALLPAHRQIRRQQPRLPFSGSRETRLPGEKSGAEAVRQSPSRLSFLEFTVARDIKKGAPQPRFESP
jgi:SEC-C motif-containing protein